MKKLNLDNGFAKEFMQRRNSALTNCILLGFVVLFLLLRALPLNAQIPVYKNGQWYAVYDDDTEYSNNEKGVFHTTRNLSNKSQPCSNQVSYYIKKSSYLASGFSINSYVSIDGSNWVNLQSKAIGDLEVSYYNEQPLVSSTLNVNDIKYIKFERTRGVGTAYEKCAGILLAKHVYVAQNNGTIHKTITVSSCNATTQTTDVFVYSFLTGENTTLSIEEVEDDDDCFSCDNSASYQVGSNKCGYPGGTSSDFTSLTDKPFTISFTANAPGTHYAKFRITDGVNYSNYIEVTGVCNIVQPTISWKKSLPSFTTATSETQYKLSDCLDITNCQYSDLKFTYSDGDVISIYKNTTDNQYYLQVKSGTTGHYTTNIKAEIECNNRGMFAASSTSDNITVLKTNLTSYTLSATPVSIAKGESSTLTVMTNPSGAYGTFNSKTFTKNSSINISETTATFSKSGLFDVQACLSESYTYNDKNSNVVHFKVKPQPFSAVTIDSPSATGEEFVIDDSRFTETFKVKAPDHFQVSTDNSTWSGEISFTTATTNPKTFYVRYNPASCGTHSGYLEVTTTGTTPNPAITEKIALSGGAASLPTLDDFGNTAILSTSVQSYAIPTVMGTGLTIDASDADGFFVSNSESSGWAKSITTTGSTIYIKFQPSVAGSYNTNIDINGCLLAVSGTGTAYTLNATQLIGLAKDYTIDLSSFTLDDDASVAVSQNGGVYIDYFVSADGTSWGTSINSFSSNTLYVKFQPSDATTLHSGTITLSSGEKDYVINAVGDGKTHTESKASADILSYAICAPDNGDWYRFKNVQNTTKYNDLVLQYPVTVQLIQSGINYMQNDMAQATFFTVNDLSITGTNPTTTGFRVGYFPFAESDVAETCTVQFKGSEANAKTYTFTITYGKAVGQTVEFEDPIYIGHASAGSESLQMVTFRGFKQVAVTPLGSGTIEANDAFLFSNSASGPWTNSYTIQNFSGTQNFFVKCVPQTATQGVETKILYVVDDNDPSRRYQFKVKYQSVESVLDFTDTKIKVGSTSSKQDFTMDNFVPQGALQATGSTNFEVSADGSTFTNGTITINSTTKKFYVRFKPTVANDAIDETVIMKDVNTGREYPLTVEGSSYVDPELHWVTNFNGIKSFNDNCGDNVITLQAASNNSSGAVSYSLDENVPSSVATLDVTTGQLTIKQANQDITVSATIAASPTQGYGTITINQTFKAQGQYFTLKDGDGNPTNNISLDFGTIDVGETKTTKVYFSSFCVCGQFTVSPANPTNFSCSLTNAPQSGDCEIGGLTDPNPYYIEITFNPKSTGAFNETFTITGSASTATITVSGSATCVPQSILWTPTTTDYKVGNTITFGATAPANNITYATSNANIVSTDGVCHRAGYATITASSPATATYCVAVDEERDYKVDFADAGINLGTNMYVGETISLTYEITDMIVPVGSLTASSTDPDFSVDFSNNKIVVVYSPTTYKATSSGTITFTDGGNGEQYHLNVSAGCSKHTPEVTWITNKVLSLNNNPENRPLSDLLQSCSYCGGATISSSDAGVIMVFNSSGQPVAAGEEGQTFWAIGTGQATITLTISETASRTSLTTSETFTVSGVDNSRVEWNQSLFFEYSGTQKTEALNAVAYKATGSTATGQKITYQIISQNPSGIVSLTQDAAGDLVSPLIINGTGTVTIKAIAQANDDYQSSESTVRTINIKSPATTTECQDIKADVTSTTTTYYFRLDGHAETDYYEVEKISYHYYVKGNKVTDWRYSGDSKTITSKVYNGATQFGSTIDHTAAGASWIWRDPETNENDQDIPINTSETHDVVTHITFSGDIGDNESKFTNIIVTPKKYLHAITNSTSHTFGSGTAIYVGQSETESLTIADYSFLNGNQVTMTLVNPEDDGNYTGGEFSILDYSSSDGDDWGKTCDYGKIKVRVKFKPLSGRDGVVHKCRIKMVGTIGNNQTTPIYFTLEGNAQRNDQQIEWNQTLNSWNSLSGNVYLTASSDKEDVQGLIGYNLISQTAVTSGETSGVVSISDGQMTIFKAGTVIVEASHPGDDKYNPATPLQKTITISLVSPTIELKHNETAIAENETINVTYGDPLYNITGKAIYNSSEISGYSVGGKIHLSSSATDVVSIENNNQLQFLKSGDATITATISQDDILAGKTFTFNVHVERANAGLHWDDESKYADDWIYVFDTKRMTALVDKSDNTGTISYSVEGGNATIDGDGNITINGYGTVSVKAGITVTDKYNEGNTKTINFTTKKVTPVVSWSGSDFTTDLSNDEYTTTDIATVAASTGEPDVSVWSGGKSVTYSSNTPEVATVKEDNTFNLLKAGYATITAKVENGTNNNASNVVTRHLKVDFDPDSPVDCGEAMVFESCSTTVNLADLMMIEGTITVTIGTGSEFTPSFDQATKMLTITYSPKEIKTPNPTIDFVTITDNGNGVQYKLYVKGKAKLFEPTLNVTAAKHDNWVFETTPNKATTDVSYGFTSGSDIYWSNTPTAISATEAQTELDRVTLSLKEPSDATYVEIVDNGRNFRVKQAKADTDDDFTVTLVATYPGLTGKMDIARVDVPITITKTQYVLDWHATEKQIYANQTTTSLNKPDLTPSGGVSTIQYSYSKANVITYDGTNQEITLLPTGKKESSVTLTACVASDIYGKGASKDITIYILRLDQYIDWTAIDITNFTTQRDVTLATDLTAIAKYQTTSTGTNIFYSVTEVSNCDDEGPLIRIDTIKTTTPYTHKLYYTGNGSGTVTIVATASGTDEYNPVKKGDAGAMSKTITISKVDCNVDNNWTVADMHYGDKATLAPAIDKSTKGNNYQYTLPTVTGELTIDGNVVDVKGVGNNLTISAKKLADCWVNESASSTASSSFNIAKSQQDIEWDKTSLGTLQTDGAYHFGVWDNNSYQLTAHAFDKLHRVQSDTWLPLDENNKFVTANPDLSSDAPGGLFLTYGIIEGDDVCKTGDATIINIGSDRKMHITGNGTGTVQIVASVVGGDYYENVSETIQVVVDKRTRSIVWSHPDALTTASLDVALGAYTVDEDDPVASEYVGTVTYSIESATQVYGQSFNCVEIRNDFLIIKGYGTASLKVTFTGSCIYQDVEDTWDISISNEVLSMSVTDPVDGTITSTDENIDMWKYFSATNYGDLTVDKMVSQPDGLDGVLTITSNRYMKLYKETASVVQVPCTLEVKSRYLSDGSHPIAVGYITFAISKGTLEFISEGKWSDYTKWNRQDIVKMHTDVGDYNYSDYNVIITASCFIGKEATPEGAGSESEWLTHRVDAACNDLTIDGTNAKLVIGEASTLKVSGKFINNDASKFYLTANYWGQASVVFSEGSPKATVEMFLPAGNGSKSNPIWQYRGIAVSGFSPITSVAIDNTTTVNPWASVKIFRWDESQNYELTHGCWVDGMSGSSVTTNSLLPWNGYAFANMSKDAIWLSYTGTLINAGKDTTLQYHDDHTYMDDKGNPQNFANLGVNLITNSFTVPLIIEKLGFPSDGCINSIVLYNAGSYSEWKTGGNVGDQRGTKRGQFSTVPATTGKTTGILTIPSGQSFFVTATEASKQFTMSYGADYYSIAPSDRMYLPRIEEPEYNVLIVDVTAKGDSIADRLFLLECDSCSRKFENGYDGMKRFGDAGLPQLYAYNKFGNTAVNADSTFNKQYIGFTAGSDDETYTISFETDRLFGYHSLYLTDRKLNQTVDILAGETYQFQGYTVGENTRFQINGVTEEEWENNEDENEDENDGSECDLRVIGNTLYVEGLTTYGYQAANIEIYDMTGNRVWSTPLTSARVYDLPTLPQSIYVIRVGDCFVKYR